LRIGNHVDDCYDPTLSELIEACNNKLDYVFADLSQRSDLSWSASVWESEEEGIGSTPEEATAKLWLALRQT
jgi:hypothetical protein